MQFLGVSLVALIAVVALVVTKATAQCPAGYELDWSEEFNGASLDTSKWGYELGMIRNNEAECYTNNTQNVRLANGTLVLEAHHEQWPNPGYVPYSPIWNQQQFAHYTSGSVETKKSWRYGYYEASARIPGGVGTWPAFWLLGSNIDEVGWPWCGELDIMENVGYSKDVIHSTFHMEKYSSMTNNDITNKTLVPHADSRFVKYAMKWTPTDIELIVDGKVLTTHKFDGGCWNATWPYDKGFNIKMNLAIGGSWGGVHGIDNSIFPVKLEFDYVRVCKPVAPQPAPTCNVEEHSMVLGGSSSWGSLMFQPEASRRLYDALQKDLAALVGVPTTRLRIQTVRITPGWQFDPSVDFLVVNVPSAQLKAAFQKGSQSSQWLRETRQAFNDHHGFGGVFVRQLPSTCQECHVSYKSFNNSHILPGNISLVDYDFGGPYRAYFDNTIWNLGGNHYRSGADWVDIGPGDGTMVVGYTTAGEWLRYTADFTESRHYGLKVRAACDLWGANSVIGISVLSQKDLGHVIAFQNVTIHDMGSWSKFHTLDFGFMKVPAGRHVVQIHFYMGNLNVNYVSFE